VTAKKDNLFLGYERIDDNGEWVYSLAGSKIWLKGIINAEEPVNRTVEELP
jgi:hypothetical protein